MLKTSYRYKPNLKRKARYALGFFKTIRKLGLRRSTSFYFWRNILVILVSNISAIETVVNLMAMYLHFQPQTRYISGLMTENLEDIKVSTDRPSEAEAFPVPDLS